MKKVQKNIRFPKQIIEIIDRHYRKTFGLTFNDFIRQIAFEAAFQIQKTQLTINNTDEISIHKKKDNKVQEYLDFEQYVRTHSFSSPKDYANAQNKLFILFKDAFD